jgi:hypothetical protein
VLGHIDLLVQSGDARELDEDDAVRFEAVRS